MVGGPWCLTGLGRLKIASLLTSWWDWVQDRSRLELLAGRSVSPSTTSFSVLRRNSAQTPSMLEPSSARESNVLKASGDATTSVRVESITSPALFYLYWPDFCCSSV